MGTLYCSLVGVWCSAVLSYRVLYGLYGLRFVRRVTAVTKGMAAGQLYMSSCHSIQRRVSRLQLRSKHANALSILAPAGPPAEPHSAHACHISNWVASTHAWPQPGASTALQARIHTGWSHARLQRSNGCLLHPRYTCIPQARSGAFPSQVRSCHKPAQQAVMSLL
jgi:hypothetical protein